MLVPNVELIPPVAALEMPPAVEVPPEVPLPNPLLPLVVALLPLPPPPQPLSSDKHKNARIGLTVRIKFLLKEDIRSDYKDGYDKRWVLHNGYCTKGYYRN